MAESGAILCFNAGPYHPAPALAETSAVRNIINKSAASHQRRASRLITLPL